MAACVLSSAQATLIAKGQASNIAPLWRLSCATQSAVTLITVIGLLTPPSLSVAQGEPAESVQP